VQISASRLDVERDPFDARVASATSGPLREFNAAGVLSAADIHVASRLAALGGERASDVILATALAVRAPPVGPRLRRSGADS
jgi:exodeoxyribonuclease V alpha subunit